MASAAAGFAPSGRAGSPRGGRAWARLPEHWSVVRWVHGEHPTAAGQRTRSRDQLARDLAGVVRALRKLDVPPEAQHDAEFRWYRAEPLTEIDSDIRRYAEQCRAIPDLDLDIDAVLLVWHEAIAVAADSPAPVTRGSRVRGDDFVAMSTLSDPFHGVVSPLTTFAAGAHKSLPRARTGR